jgi:hypothetical protein
MSNGKITRRANSYQSRDLFFQKLLYQYNESKKAVDIIAEKLTESLKHLFTNKSHKVSRDITDSGIYFNYPEMNSGYSSSPILHFHLTLHTMDPYQIRHNKIHFSFKINGWKYTYPLIQDGNILSKKPIIGDIVAGTVVYKNKNNNNIDIIIKNTREIIKTILDEVDKKMDQDKKAEDAKKAAKKADIDKIYEIASKEYIKEKGNAFKLNRFGRPSPYFKNLGKAQNSQKTDTIEILKIAIAKYEEYIQSKAVNPLNHNLEIDKIAKAAYEEYMKEKYPESKAENSSNSNSNSNSNNNNNNLEIAPSASSSSSSSSPEETILHKRKIPLNFGFGLKRGKGTGEEKATTSILGDKRNRNKNNNNNNKNNNNKNKNNKNNKNTHNNKRVRRGWGAGFDRKSGGSKEKNKLNSIKTKYLRKYLRKYCKKNKLKGYSEYNKKDLINFIKNNVTKKLT